MKKTEKQTRKNQGFTLIELLVVLAIIGILAVLILTNLATARAKARDAQRKSDLKHLADAIEMYAEDNGYSYPLAETAQTLEEVTDSVAITSVIEAGNGKYIKKRPVDPRESATDTIHRYKYATDSTGSEFELWAKMEVGKTDNDWFLVTSSYSEIKTNLATPTWDDGLATGTTPTAVPTNTP